VDFYPILAAIDGQQLLGSLFALAIWALILWVLWWGLRKIALPEPWNKLATVVLVLLTVVIAINILFGLLGKQPFIRF
jgi:heme A synthase